MVFDLYFFIVSDDGVSGSENFKKYYFLKFILNSILYIIKDFLVDKAIIGFLLLKQSNFHHFRS